MRFFFFCIVLVFSYSINTYAQYERDYFVTKENDTTKCLITFINKQNIFYEYNKNHQKPGKKEKIVNDYIAKEDVLTFYCADSVEATFKKIEETHQCDTCKNWVVFFPDDTLYHDLYVSFIKKDSKIIKKVRHSYTGHNTEFKPWEIKAAYWDSTEYISLYVPDTNMNEGDSLVRYCLGMYLIKDSISLIEYAIYKRKFVISFSVLGEVTEAKDRKEMNKKLIGLNTILALSMAGGLRVNTSTGSMNSISGLPFPGFTGSESDVYDVQTGFYINKDLVTIPEKDDEFISFATKFFSDYPALVEKIKSKTYTQKHLKEITKEYNQFLKEQ